MLLSYLSSFRRILPASTAEQLLGALAQILDQRLGSAGGENRRKFGASRRQFAHRAVGVDVDDARAAGYVLGKLLERMGQQVRTATDASAGRLVHRRPSGYQQSMAARQKKSNAPPAGTSARSAQSARSASGADDRSDGDRADRSGTSRSSKTVAKATRHAEIETKLEIAPGTPLPDLTGRRKLA